MAKKGGKTYSITELELEEMIRKASEAGAEAYKREYKESSRKKVGSPGEVYIPESVCCQFGLYAGTGGGGQ